MGAFNVVIGSPIHCGNCARSVRPEVAFHYGNKWQDLYSVGDQLRWGGNDEGEPGHKIVIVRGYALKCPNCGAPTGIDDYEITLRNDVIEKVEPYSGQYECLSQQSYCVIED